MANRLGRLAATIGVLGMLAAVVACSSGGSPSGDGVIITPIDSGAVPPPLAGDSTLPATQPTAVAPATGPTNGGSELHGFAFPILGGCLPKGDQLMPGAARDYRLGIHEGVDFYDSDNCTGITRGTEVHAAKAGRVIRADLDYTDLTPQELASVMANPTTQDSLDKFRGRQVWVDHGGGVVTRYVHLSSIAPGIVTGVAVAQGQLLAAVGESGTPESVQSPGHEYHLHFEVRVGTGCAVPTAAQLVNCAYLGQGQTPAQVRGLYQTLFSP